MTKFHITISEPNVVDETFAMACGSAVGTLRIEEMAWGRRHFVVLSTL